jgi:hypothetical protein
MSRMMEAIWCLCTEDTVLYLTKHCRLSSEFSRMSRMSRMMEVIWCLCTEDTVLYLTKHWRRSSEFSRMSRMMEVIWCFCTEDTVLYLTKHWRRSSEFPIQSYAKEKCRRKDLDIRKRLGTFGFHKMQVNSLVAEQLKASREGLVSMQ